jgi:hypothetical protein
MNCCFRHIFKNQSECDEFFAHTVEEGDEHPTNEGKVIP